MGALLGAELGVWVSEPGELERLAHSLGVASRHAGAREAPNVPADVTVGSPGVHGNADGWHVAAEAAIPRAAIPSVDVSVLPRAGATPTDTTRSSRPTPRVTRRARAHAGPASAPASSDSQAPLDPSTLSNALSDALGE